MYCSNCKASIADNSAFCPVCGATQYSQNYPPAQNAWPQQQPPPPPAAPYAPQQPWQPAPPRPVQSYQGVPAQPQYANIPPHITVPRRQKTGFGIVCGIIFVLLGLGAMAYYAYSLYITYTESISWDFAQFITGFVFGNAVNAIYVVSDILAFFCGLFLLFAGIFSLNSGRGRSPAVTALVFIITALLCDVAAIVLLDQIYGIFFDINIVLKSWVIYAIKLGLIVLIGVLLPIKKAVKKRKRVAATAPVQYATAPMQYGAQPAEQTVPAAPIAPAAPAAVDAALAPAEDNTATEVIATEITVTEVTIADEAAVVPGEPAQNGEAALVEEPPQDEQV